MILIKILLRIWQFPQYLYGLFLLGKCNLDEEIGWHWWKMYQSEKTAYCGELNFVNGRLTELARMEQLNLTDGYVTLSRISGIWYPIMLLINGQNWAKALQIPSNAQKRPFKAIIEVLGINILLWCLAAVLGHFLTQIG